MKKLAFALTAALIIAAAPSLYARGGFSLGLFGAYSIDGGAIEQTINEKRNLDYFTYGSNSSSSYDSIVIPGCGLFAAYIFSNGLSLRAGGEFYKIVSGENISKTISGNNHHFRIDYEAAAFPIMLGFTCSPDKGKTNIYGYAGVVFSMIDVSQYYEYYNAGNYMYKSENSFMVPGFASIFGLEKRIFAGLYIMLEYAFYKCEESREESGDYSQNGTFMSKYKFTERYGLPLQQIRLGLRYAF